MSKSIFFVRFLKNINKTINNLLEKNLNKLKFNNLTNIARSNKIFLIFVALIILFLSYILIPNIYNQDEISKKLESQLINKFDLNFNFPQKLNYNFFPRPHFTSKDSIILINQDQISSIKKIKIFVSLENLFSIKNIEIKEVILENANFNLNAQNYNFFTKILDNNFIDSNLKIQNSNIFFKNNDGEILFINKILNMKYYYDMNELKNIFYSENELFNIPYVIELFHNKEDKKFVSKLNFKFLNLQIKNSLIYKHKIKKGIAEIIYNKLKSTISYKTNNNFFEFNFFDKIENPNFSYNGMINFNPFYSNFDGITNEVNLSYFLNQNSLIIQLLKSELLNNKNLNFDLNINAKKINDYQNFINIILNSKIEEGLLDIDNTKFGWKDYAKFKLSDTLIFLNNGELILDGKLNIEVLDYEEIYKFLLTPKNFRNEIKKIDLDFNFNFDQKTILFENIRVDDQLNKDLNNIMKKMILKNNLKNKIFIKNLLNEAIENYFG